MVYMGSKRRYAKDIVPIINKYILDNGITLLIDCFCGGANITDKIQCDNVIGNDLSPTLIALHKQAQRDFSLIPTEGSREYWDAAYVEWKRIKKYIDAGETELTESEEMPFFKVGAIEWYGSFSNGGFPRGYAKPSAGRDYYKEAYRNHQQQAETANYKKIKFIHGDYRALLPMAQYIAETTPIKILLYCDSPYRGTKPYAINSHFDFDTYHQWLREASQQFPIFVSEQTLPEDFNDSIIWSKDATRTCGLDNNYKAVETLWLLDRRDNG